MVPEFITDDYVRMCRESEHVQGWWTATWEAWYGGLPPCAMMTPVGFVERIVRDPEMDAVASKHFGRHMEGAIEPCPPWALPPGGTGLQTNVRTGDMITGVGGVVATVSDVGRGVRSPGIFVNGLPMETIVDHGIVFLPRLDQVMTIIGMEAGTGMMLSFNSRLSPTDHLHGGLIRTADRALMRLGCPARKV